MILLNFLRFLLNHWNKMFDSFLLPEDFLDVKLLVVKNK